MMEEARPGQQPDADRPMGAERVHERASPGNPPKISSPKERRQIADAREKAGRDVAEREEEGFGDHKGTEGF